MRIRKGFVSNSSSTSFIVDGSKYTCADVAKWVAETVYMSGEYDDPNEDKFNQIVENLDKLENKDIPMYFDLSDDGQIIKLDGKIYVDITRNYDWDNFDYESWAGEGEFYEKFENVNKWYFPVYDNKLLGDKLWRWDISEKYSHLYKNNGDECKCGEYPTWLLIESGEVMCAKCGRDPDGRIVKALSREPKLNRILKDIEDEN